VSRCRFLLLALVPLAVAGRARADDFSFRKGPYLQGLGTRSVVVRWEGSAPAPGVISVSAAKGPAHETKTTEPLSFHSVELTGLEPATSYTYVVKAGDAKAEGHFTTAPDEKKPFSFVLYGDNRTDQAAHESVVRAILRTPSDFLVHSGDMVMEGNDDNDWNVFFTIERALLRDRCVFAAVGNHELLGRGEPPFLRYFHPAPRGEKTLQYSVRWSNARFFLVNAMASWDAGPDKAWLEAELTKSDAEPGVDLRFVVMHHSPFSSGPHGDNNAFLRAGLGDVLRAHKVTMVFAGHDHVYERGEKDGIRYLVSGGGGAPLYPLGKKRSSATIAFESSHHFVEVAVDGARVTTTARRPDGSILEKCGLEGAGSWDCSGLAPLPKPPAPKPPSTSPDATPAKKACDCSVPGAPQPGDSGWAFGLGLGLVACSRLRRARRIS
jgi:hypothetical protein